MASAVDVLLKSERGQWPAGSGSAGPSVSTFPRSEVLSYGQLFGTRWAVPRDSIITEEVVQAERRKTLE